MKQNLGRRIRGRSRAKDAHNPNRLYESNGPEIKIKGSALAIAERYLQLARDSQASGNYVAAENFFQHGEHYIRLTNQSVGDQPLADSTPSLQDHEPTDAESSSPASAKSVSSSAKQHAFEDEPHTQPRWNNSGRRSNSQARSYTGTRNGSTRSSGNAEPQHERSNASAATRTVNREGVLTSDPMRKPALEDSQQPSMVHSGRKRAPNSDDKSELKRPPRGQVKSNMNRPAPREEDDGEDEEALFHVPAFLMPGRLPQQDFKEVSRTSEESRSVEHLKEEQEPATAQHHYLETSTKHASDDV